jgi:hypothetical protein
MPSVKELMEGNKRFKKQSSYAQTNLTPTSVRNAVGRSDVGGSASEMSDFLGAVMNTAPKALDAYNRSENEKNEKLKKQGYLEYKNAKPSSLKAFRENSPLSENPYYKWGTDTADAEKTLQVKANSYEQDYNEWKFNKPMMGDPEDLEKGEYAQTHEEFNKAWIEKNRPDLENRNPIIMGESFWPGMDAVMAAKAKDHAQYEAQIYKEETERTRSSSYDIPLDDPDAQNELLKSPDSMETMLALEDSTRETTTLIENMAFGSDLTTDDIAKSKMGLRTDQRELFDKIIGNKILTGGQSKEQTKTSAITATDIMGQSFKSSSVSTPSEPPIVKEDSTSETIAMDYKLLSIDGRDYKKPAGDITVAQFKKASHYPDLVGVEKVETEVSASSGKGGRLQAEAYSKRKGKRKKIEPKKAVVVAPQDEVKAPVHKRQTYGAMSYMNEAKTAEFLPKIQGTWSNILEGVLSDSSLPKEVYGSFEANKWQGKGRLQIQFKMPPKHILDQYPEAKKVNEDLMQKVMQKLEITTPITNEGML